MEDSDIPHRNFIRAQVISAWKQLLLDFKSEMKVISFFNPMVLCV